MNAMKCVLISDVCTFHQHHHRSFVLLKGYPRAVDCDSTSWFTNRVFLYSKFIDFVADASLCALSVSSFRIVVDNQVRALRIVSSQGSICRKIFSFERVTFLRVLRFIGKHPFSLEMVVRPVDIPEVIIGELSFHGVRLHGILNIPRFTRPQRVIVSSCVMDLDFLSFLSEHNAFSITNAVVIVRPTDLQRYSRGVSAILLPRSTRFAVFMDLIAYSSAPTGLDQRNPYAMDVNFGRCTYRLCPRNGEWEKFFMTDSRFSLPVSIL